LEVDLMRKIPRRPKPWVLVPALAGLVASLLLWRRRAGNRVEGARWYGFVYRTAYLLGLKVWDRDVPLALADLVELVEGASAPGRALDLGCGTGTDSVYLAQHGWDVTGVDMVPKALSIARRKAAAGVPPRFLEGDVTRLQDFGIGGGYTLLLDFGCFHTLPRDRRDAYGQSVSEAAAPGAMFLLYGFKRPPRLAPMLAGLTAEEVRDRFASNRWLLLSAEPVWIDEMRAVGRRVDETFEVWRYRLRRR
jgi:SAM-dependent methyltransferase